MARTAPPALSSSVRALLLLLACALLPALATAQVSGTNWVVKGKAMLKVKGSGAVPSFKAKVSGPALVRFLPGGAFELIDAAELFIAGDWNETVDGLDVVVDSTDIFDFLDGNLFSLPTGLTVDKLSSSVKLTGKKNGTSVLVYKLGFVLNFTVNGDDVELIYKLTVKGINDLTGASSTGATWTVDGTQRYKAKGNKLKVDAPLQLVLGPDGGLPADRFSLRDGGGTTLFDGWCTRVGNKIAMLPDSATLESYVEVWIAPSVDQLFPGGTVSLDVFKSIFKAAVKKNGALRLRGKSVFSSDLDRGPKSGFFKSAYRVTGSS